MELSSAQLTDDAVPERVNDHKEPTMLIVDAQIHLWNAGNPTSPWHRQISAYLKAYLKTRAARAGREVLA